MYSIIALLACVGAASASICCVPPQWEGMSSFLTSVVHKGKPHIATGFIKMAYDSVNHKIGQYEYINIGRNTPQRTYGVLLDYESNTKYVVDGKGMCYRQTLNRKVDTFGGCVPDNATRVGVNDIVGFSNNAMNIDTYKFEFPGIVAYVSLTANTCVPVVETIRGSVDGHLFLQNSHFFNITAGLSKPEDLKVPPTGCENAPHFSAHYSVGGPLANIGRRSHFLGF